MTRINMKRTVDKTDRVILSLLQKNCKLGVREIAEKTGWPITTVFARIKKLEKAGVIRDYKAILDSERLDKGTTVFILASVSKPDVAKYLADLPEVQEVHLVTGDWDVLIKLKIKDIRSLSRFLFDKVRIVKEVERTLTCTVLSTYKETSDIDLENPAELS
jgi:Lrp/AsnC family leucine-responsive transcriptional regulator